MSNIIGVVNYGISGNIHSIKKAVEKAGGAVLVIDSKEQFGRVDKIIIPGVGSFKDAMQELKNDNLLMPLIEEIKLKPTLGICLGMQLLAEYGFEYGKTKGLSAIQAEVRHMIVDDKVPHMGFNKIKVVKNNKLLNGLDGEEFYFMHSYEVINYINVSSLTTYSEHTFVSSIQSDNIYGVQFHPEKSKDAGIELLCNFIKL